MNTPDDKWINDWIIDENPNREKELGRDLVQIFIMFWQYTKLSSKSKTTQNRYIGALHCLGGYLIEKGIYENVDFSLYDLLNEYLDEYGGPLIHYDNEIWQNELDMVCRKLYKYLKTEKPLFQRTDNRRRRL